MKPRDYIPIAMNWLKHKYRDAINPPYEVTPLVADFYLSVGGDCRTATQLRRNGLRICSSPLDWMMAYSIQSAARLFSEKLKTFFLDIKEHEHDDPENRMIEDCANGMISIHHFPKSLSVEAGQKRFHEISRRRFSFVDSCLTKSEHIAFVTNRTEPMAELCLFLEAMRKIYPAKMTLVNIRNGKSLAKHMVTIDTKTQIIDYTFDDISLNERRGIKGGWHQGNNYEWQKILRKCKRTRQFNSPEQLERKSYN